MYCRVIGQAAVTDRFFIDALVQDITIFHMFIILRDSSPSVVFSFYRRHSTSGSFVRSGVQEGCVFTGNIV